MFCFICIMLRLVMFISDAFIYHSVQHFGPIWMLQSAGLDITNLECTEEALKVKPRRLLSLVKLLCKGC